MNGLRCTCSFSDSGLHRAQVSIGQQNEVGVLQVVTEALSVTVEQPDPVAGLGLHRHVRFADEGSIMRCSAGTSEHAVGL